jgi:hypothetical protein
VTVRTKLRIPAEQVGHMIARALYRTYLYLIMVVEEGPRGFGASEIGQRHALTARALLDQMRVLLQELGPGQSSFGSGAVDASGPKVDE